MEPGASFEQFVLHWFAFYFHSCPRASAVGLRVLTCASVAFNLQAHIIDETKPASALHFTVDKGTRSVPQKTTSPPIQAPATAWPRYDASAVTFSDMARLPTSLPVPRGLFSFNPGQVELFGSHVTIKDRVLRRAELQQGWGCLQCLWRILGKLNGMFSLGFRQEAQTLEQLPTAFLIFPYVRQQAGRPVEAPQLFDVHMAGTQYCQ